MIGIIDILMIGIEQELFAQGIELNGFDLDEIHDCLIHILKDKI